MAKYILQLDFQIEPKRRYWLGLLLLIIGLTSLTIVTIQYRDIQQKIASFNKNMHTLSSKDLSETAQNKIIRQYKTKEVAEYNAVIRQLDLPWNSLFESIENSQTASIVLLAVEPDVATQTVRIFGETENLKSIPPYLKQLHEEEFFYNITLTEHQITNNNVRFSITASWIATQ